MSRMTFFHYPMSGIYLHIPFCKWRCIYCDFFSTTQNEECDRYVRALCLELEQRKDYLGKEEITTVYFGGGTPSQLNERHFDQLFSVLSCCYTLCSNAEITIEANPDDLQTAYVHMLRQFPFNRLSIGIQTFNDSLLRLLHRRHTAIQAVTAFDVCREAGFDNISIDLMYGLPDETSAMWHADLQQTLRMRPEHISAYHLIYEEDTALWRMRDQHRVEEIDEDLSVAFFSDLIHTLKDAGYRHYEISNFCLPDRHSRHNSGYWTGKKYMGCGASAHSYNGISRQWNTASLEAYMEGIENHKPNFGTEELDLYTRYNDFIITSLRTSWGMSLSHLKTAFGEQLYAYCLQMAAPYLQQATLTISGDVLKLSGEGIFISDGIMSDLLWVE